MGQVHPLPAESDGRPASMLTTPPPVRAIESARCGLCGAKLTGRSLRYHVVSPQRCEMMTVCHTCHKAALGEGYRPAE
jgi:hypothetical protein